jgi:hypothetical protein
MYAWKCIFAAAIMVAASLTSGCRSGISTHGKTASLFLVPMYKQPAGYSSTYHRHLALVTTVKQHTISEFGDAKAIPVTPSNTSESVDKPDEVVFPTANRPEYRKQPTVDPQPTGGLHSPSPGSNRKPRHPGLIQSATLDGQGA